MPIPFIGPVATAAGVLVRQLVKYAWGPLVTGVGHLFKSRAGLFIFAAMAWLGIAFVTMNVIIEPAISLLRDMTANLSTGSGSIAEAAGAYIGIMQMDRAVTMIISAVVTRHAVTKGRLFLSKVGA